MVQRQIIGVKSLATVLTLVLVSQKDVASGKGGRLMTHMHIFIQGNHTGQRNLQASGPNRHIRIHVDDSHLATKNGLDGVLPRP
jgi:hypothetical protein